MEKQKGMSNTRVITYGNQNGRHPHSPARFLGEVDRNFSRVHWRRLAGRR